MDINWFFAGYRNIGTNRRISSREDKLQKLFLYSLFGFTLASVLCAIAWDIDSLIVFRILQGAFCGLIIPVTMAIVYHIIPKEKQAFAISLWGLAASLAPAFGPTISGWLLQSFAWQWLFIMNIPIGIIAIFLVAKYIPYYRLNVPKVLIFLGYFLSLLGVRRYCWHLVRVIVGYYIPFYIYNTFKLILRS